MAIRIRFRKFIELDTEAELDISLGDAETLFYTLDTSKYWRILSGNFEEVLEEQIFQKLPLEISDLNISGTPDGTKFLRDDGSWAEPPGTGGGGSGSGTVNSGAQYRLPYYSTNPTGTTLDAAAAITASRALKSDANGVPTHFDTATEPSLTELSYVKGVTSAIQTQLDGKLSAADLDYVTAMATLSHINRV